MTTVAITQGLIFGLTLLLVPLSLMWAYALYDSLRRVIQAERAVAQPFAERDVLTWPALLLLTGFFGGLAYLFLVVMPRQQRPRAGLRLQAISAT